MLGPTTTADEEDEEDEEDEAKEGVGTSVIAAKLKPTTRSAEAEEEDEEEEDEEEDEEEEDEEAVAEEESKCCERAASTTPTNPLYVLKPSWPLLEGSTTNEMIPRPFFVDMALRAAMGERVGERITSSPGK